MDTKYISEGDRLRIKGQNAEQVIYELATKTFLQDWCFLNPKFSKGTKELCDLLVVFDDNVIIRQIKDLKLDENGKYKKKEKEKNIKQLGGAKRILFSQQAQITLTNNRRKEIVFDPTTIKNIYLISALVGEGEYFCSFMEEIKSHSIHVFNRNFIEIALNELDTISDFIHYLQSKEEFSAKYRNIILNGGEEELLASYLHNNRAFPELDSSDIIFLDEGMRECLTKKPEYIAKKKENEISYFWDFLINKTHQGGDQYELVARELARINRFERRYLSKVFIEGHSNANNDTVNNTYRRFIPIVEKGVTYCFLYQDIEHNKNRQENLLTLCHIARMEFDTPKIIGIATEQYFHSCESYDFILLNIPTLSNEEIESLKMLKNNSNILQNPQQKNIHEDEYPIQK